MTAAIFNQRTTKISMWNRHLDEMERQYGLRFWSNQIRTWDIFIWAWPSKLEGNVMENLSLSELHIPNTYFKIKIKITPTPFVKVLRISDWPHHSSWWSVRIRSQYYSSIFSVTLESDQNFQLKILPQAANCSRFNTVLIGCVEFWKTEGQRDRSIYQSLH